MKTDKPSVPRIASLGVRTGLALVFLWASWEKILHPGDFAAIISNYDILPVAAVNLAALVLPWVEFICGLLLLCGRLVPGAALTIDTLLFIFLLATGFNLYRGLDVNCGCFSVSPAAGGETLVNLGRNSLLLAAGIWLFVYTAGRPEPESFRPAGGMVDDAG